MRMNTWHRAFVADVYELTHWYIGGLSFIELEGIDMFVFHNDGETTPSVAVVVRVSGLRSLFSWMRKRVARELDQRMRKMATQYPVDVGVLVRAA